MHIARWPVLLALVGLLISAYLTAVHYAQGQLPLACATGSLVNCEQVTSSAESMVGPVPVAVLGVVWFSVQLTLTVVHTPRSLLLAWSSAGLAFVFYLVYAELFLIGAICLWCTAVHLLVVALFLLAIGETTAEGIEATA